MPHPDNLAAELLPEIRKIPVVDCHEHLPLESERTAEKIDVSTLFSHYCRADLAAAGLEPGPPQESFFDTSKPLMVRWRAAAPFIEAIRFGSYAWPAFFYVREVLGFDDINESTVEAISERLQSDNKPGVYRKLMQELSGIEKTIQCTDDRVADDQPWFVYLCRDKVTGLGTRAALEELQRVTDCDIHTLSDCVRALQVFVANQKSAGSVGLKIGAAYQRTLEYLDVPASEAEPIFAQLRRGMRSQLSDGQLRLLEDYLMRRQIEACIDHNMPVVIHTGYQAGNRNDIRNARATQLWSLLTAYPRARFDLFHGSFPYVSDMTVLGKYFPNVTLNMCWMHIMGPELSRRALREWLDAVPVTKIFAFGGDYRVPEKIYGHIELARRNLATVLAERVESGRITEADAIRIAQLLLRENPKQWYSLDD